MSINTKSGDLHNNSNPNDPNRYMSNGKFDLGKFNTAFQEQKDNQNKINAETDEYKLRMMNSDVMPKSLYQSNISDIIIGIKNTWFYILDDLLQQKFTIYTFTKNNRLFFVGITLILIAIIMYLYYFFAEDESECKNKQNQKIIEKHFIYKNKHKDNNETTAKKSK